jgi:CheY-like chemotaxis protein
MTLPGTQAAGAPSQRILVCEELALNRDLLNAVLSRQGHRLMFADDGAHAVELVEQHGFDVVLMDVQMRGIDGVEATRRIRGLGGRLARLPIIGLVARQTAHEQVRYLAAGMSECLVRPLDWDGLRAALMRHAPVPTPSSGAAAPPQLVDVHALERLTRAVGEAALASLLQEGIDAYRDCFRSMSEAADGRAGVLRDAHKLRGSAGTLGLHAVACAAEDIESSLKAGKQRPELMDVLGRAIAATQATLVALGLLPMCDTADAGERG